MRTSVAALALLLVTTGSCSTAGDQEATPPEDDSVPSGQSLTPGSSSAPGESTEEGRAKGGSSPTQRPARAPHPVSLPALMEHEYDGRGLRLGRETASTDAYVTHQVTYRSGELTISGLMNLPRGSGPFPALVLAHGYIDPDIYATGQGLRREQDHLARAGYVTLHVDYRNHAGSDDDPAADRRLRLGYTEDVINAVHALRGWRAGPVDGDRIGLVGRSMGGGIVYNVLTVAPGLVDAGVVFAPVSSDTVDNFDRWIRPDPGRAGLADEIVSRYGAPDEAPGFWRRVSPRTYFDRVTEPVMIHHGTLDDSCPIDWSRRTVRALRAEGKQVRFHVYEGEQHAFGPQWPLSMRRTVDFLDRHLDG
ncbi:S9 family peptidase [Nocardioides sp.]|uniref:alpha/beta hydrolase family protein n=1 Tax=Nocardioides sp. TaxID=35761 RepID=UPI0027334D33|nr:alpha/beta fold hydrolase [Nocardioides sp.]MDP3894633.1 prolyl oligopeptidase family serine peptidase [Nocardioides sp.]